MNENDLVNAELHDDANGLGEVAAVVATPVAVAAEEVQTPQAPAVATEEVVKVRSGAGRKVDTTGKTALGAARMLYAANPSLGTKELRALFVKELGPKFNTSEQVAQTYVSLVRKPKKAA